MNSRRHKQVHQPIHTHQLISTTSPVNTELHNLSQHSTSISSESCAYKTEPGLHYFQIYQTIRCPHRTIQTGACQVRTSSFKRSWWWLALTVWRASTDADRCALHGTLWSCRTSGRARARGILSKLTLYRFFCFLFCFWFLGIILEENRMSI